MKWTILDVYERTLHLNIEFPDNNFIFTLPKAIKMLKELGEKKIDEYGIDYSDMDYLFEMTF